jgi:hypothetical protein
MNDATKNKVIWLFACCVSFVFVFMTTAIVGGFIAARMLGLPVDTDRFYNTIGPAFFMILGAVLNMFPGNLKNKQADKGPEE